MGRVWGACILLAVWMCTTGHALQFSASNNTWVEYQEWKGCWNGDAEITFEFQTNVSEGLMLYVKAKASRKEEVGDYLLVELVRGHLRMEVNLVYPPMPATLTLNDKSYADGETHKVRILRERMNTKMGVDKQLDRDVNAVSFGSDFYFGSPDEVANVYFGGWRLNGRTGRPTAPNLSGKRGFTGRIWNIAYHSCNASSQTNAVPVPGGLEPGSPPAVFPKESCYDRVPDQVPGKSCLCKSEEYSTQCRCDRTCIYLDDASDGVRRYHIMFDSIVPNHDNQTIQWILNSQGLDAHVVALGPIMEFKRGVKSFYLTLGPGTYAELAGQSHSDECLGNLERCPNGYTFSIWMALSGLLSRGDMIMGTAGSTGNLAGMALTWEDGSRLALTFRRSDGSYMRVFTDQVMPVPGYFYSVAGTWRPQGRGGGALLQLYINGRLAGETRAVQQGSRPPKLRVPFYIGSPPQYRRKYTVSIDEFHFQDRFEENVPALYYHIHGCYISMNSFVGSSNSDLTAYPSISLSGSLARVIRLSGSAKIVRGAAGQALELTGGAHVEIDMQQSSCLATLSRTRCVYGVYASMFVRVDEAADGLVFLDTGSKGFRLSYRQNRIFLDAGKYVRSHQVNAKQWYFVEVSISSNYREYELWVDMKKSVTENRLAVGSTWENSRGTIVRIGSPAGAGSSRGRFCVDDVELYTGERSVLKNIRWILRDTPIYFYMTMDGTLSSLTVGGGGEIGSYDEAPTARIPSPSGSVQSTVGVAEEGLLFNQGGRIIWERNDAVITQTPCYSNLDQCVHGLMVSIWVNLGEPSPITQLLNTGRNGLSVRVNEDRSVTIQVTTTFRQWQITSGVGLDPDEWHFLEVTYNPKYGIDVYLGLQLVGSDTVGMTRRSPGDREEIFIVGNIGGTEPVVVDQMDVWYSYRDFLQGHGRITRGCPKHYVISFDVLTGGEFVHDNLCIKNDGAYPVKGKVDKAVEMRGNNEHVEIVAVGSRCGDKASLSRSCIGNLRHCQQGLTITAYIRFDLNHPSSNDDISYLWSSGVNGLRLYRSGKRGLVGEASLDTSRWTVKGDVLLPDPPASGAAFSQKWYFVEMSWHPQIGLRLWVDQKRVPTTSTITVQDSSSDTTPFMIGHASRHDLERHRTHGRERVSATRAMFDHIEIWYADRNEIVPLQCTSRGHMTPQSFSFERNLIGTQIEHALVEGVSLISGARLTDSRNGNATILSGRGSYVDLGRSVSGYTCYLNPSKCRNGLTISVRVKADPSKRSNNQYILSSEYIDILIDSNQNILAKLRADDQEWKATGRSLSSYGQWQDIDVTWSPHAERQFIIYVNAQIVGSDDTGSLIAGQPSSDLDRRDAPRRMQVGQSIGRRDSSIDISNTFAGQIDEVKFWHAPLSELRVHDLWTSGGQPISHTLLDFEDIKGTQARTGPPGYGQSVHLIEGQRIIIGTSATCLHQTAGCGNGLMLRMRFNLREIPDRETVFVSGFPISIQYTGNGLEATYTDSKDQWTAVSGSVQLTLHRWYTMDLSWDLENGLTLWLDNSPIAWGQKPRRTGYLSSVPRPNMLFASSAASTLNCYMDDVRLYSAKRELVNIVKEEPERIIVWPATGSGYFRWVYKLLPDFVKIRNQKETLTIDLETTDNLGHVLLWYTELESEGKIYVMLRDGRPIVVYRTPGGEVREIQTNVQINDGQRHRLIVQRIGTQYSLFVDPVSVTTAASVGQGDFEDDSQLINEVVYIGGHRNASSATHDKTMRGFGGRVYYLTIVGDQESSKLDMIEEFWKERFPIYTRLHRELTFEYDIPGIKLYDPNLGEITFLTRRSSLYVDELGSGGTRPTIQITFATTEPDGLLLFASSESANLPSRLERSNFFAVELSDGRLRMAAALYSEGRFISEDISRALVADGVSRTYKFILDAGSNEIVVMQIKGGISTQIRSKQFPVSEMNLGVRLHIGSYNYDPATPTEGVIRSQLPWDILSEKGYVGCVLELIVSSEFVDLVERAESLRVPALHWIKGCSGTTPQCQSISRGVLGCLNGGKCINRWRMFDCDCTNTGYNGKTCHRLSLIASFNGSEYHTRNVYSPESRSHVDRLSVRFRTMYETGVLFQTFSSRGDYYKASLKEGGLIFETRINDEVRSLPLPSKFNDASWHTLHIRRRAGSIKFWVDDEDTSSATSRTSTVQEINMQTREFEFHLGGVRLGAAYYPGPGPKPYLLGSLMNFFINGKLISGPPFNNETIILEPRDSVTYLTTESHSRITSEPGTLHQAFHIIFYFKGSSPDGILLYQPGTRGNYLVILLEGGRVKVFYQFGQFVGVINSAVGGLNNDRWHSVDLHRPDMDVLTLSIDSGLKQREDLSGDDFLFTHSGDTKMYVGGIPIGVYLPPSLPLNHGYRGCMATFFKDYVIHKLFDWQPDAVLLSQMERGCVNTQCIGKCLNGGVCTPQGCNCSFTTYEGTFCEKPSPAYHFNKQRVIYTGPTSGSFSSLVFAFATCLSNTRIAALQNVGEFFIISLANGKLQITHDMNEDGISSVMTVGKNFSDARYHIVKILVNGRSLDVNVDGESHLASGTLDDVTAIPPVRIATLGASKSVSPNFVGLIRGFAMNLKHYPLTLISRQETARWRLRYNPDSPDFSNATLAECLPPDLCSTDDDCKNYGWCWEGRCQCLYTSYKGDKCLKHRQGVYFGKSWTNYGAAIFRYDTPRDVLDSRFATGFMTHFPNGTIFYAQGDKGDFYHIYLENGMPVLRYQVFGNVGNVKIDQTFHDGEYHIVRFNRTGSQFQLFVDDFSSEGDNSELSGTSFHSLSHIYTGGVVKNQQISNPFHGIISGMVFEDDIILPNTMWVNDVIKVVPPYVVLKPPTECTSNSNCHNGGLCENSHCICLHTGYVGYQCKDIGWGTIHKEYMGNSSYKYTFDGSISAVNDLTVGFLANREQTGDIVSLWDEYMKKYFRISMEGKQLVIRHNLYDGTEESFSAWDLPWDLVNGDYYVLTFHQEADNTYVILRDDKTEEERKLTLPSDFFAVKYLFAGGVVQEDKTVGNGFYGIIAGLVWNKIEIIEQLKLGKGQIFTTGEGNFRLTPPPWVLRRWDDLEPEPTGPVGGGGGTIPINISGTKALAVTAVPSVSIAAIFGALMGGLLFTSALIWAAHACKPGYLPCFGGAVGAKGGKGAGAFPVNGTGGGRAVSVYDTSFGGADTADGAGITEMDTLIVNSKFGEGNMKTNTMESNGGTGGGYGIDSYNTTTTSNNFFQKMGGYGGSYAGSVAGSVAGFGTATNPEQGFVTLSEDIQVEKCCLSTDGKLVVTGSSTGTPQMWSTSNGDAMMTLAGDGYGSTGLHVGCGGDLLLAEILTDQGGIDYNQAQAGNHLPLKMIRSWDFHTGNPLNVAENIYCTASCLSKDTNYLITANTDRFGSGTIITVFDLPRNQELQTVQFDGSIGVGDSACCVFVSPDNRYVAAGFSNSFDGNANFVIVDLQRERSVVTNPEIMALPADPHCTVVLNTDEAITGTRGGELTVWSMKTGKAQRQLASSDGVGPAVAHGGEVKGVALSEDGKYLVSASADKTAKIWDMSVNGGVLHHTLSGHTDEVTCTDIAKDNSLVVTGSRDGTIRLWRVSQGRLIASFNTTMDVFSVEMSRDRQTVVALGDQCGTKKLIMLQIVSQKRWKR